MNVGRLDEAPSIETFESTAWPFLERQSLWRRAPALRRLRLKHWQFLSLFGEEVYAAFGLVTLHYATLVFADVADRRSPSRPIAFRTLIPGALGVDRGGSPRRGHFRVRHPLVRIDVDRDGPDAPRRVDALAFTAGGALRASLAFREDAGRDRQALTLLSDLGGGRPSLTYKVAAVPVEGEIEVDRRCHALDSETTLGCVDWTTAYSTRVTTWNWSSGAGWDRDGRRIGFNLARGINESAEGLNENALWIEGRRFDVATARFSFSPRLPTSPWTVKTDDGALNLRLLPLGLRREETNAGLLRTSLLQVHGPCQGAFLDESGEPRVLVRGYAIGEDHVAAW